MNNFHYWAGIIAGVLALLGYVPYIIGILRGETRPNRATWMIWALVGGLLAFSFMSEGDSSAVWLPLGYFIGPLFIAILSLRYGYSIWSRLDTVCIIAALISIIPWIYSHNATYTLLINLFIDSVGAVPTIIKSYKEPETEDFYAWIIFFIANTIELISIRHWNIASLYPIYLFLLAGSITLFIFIGKIKKRFN